MSLNLRETQTVPSTYDLLQTLVALRRDVMAEGDNLFGNGLTFIQREAYRKALATWHVILRCAVATSVLYKRRSCAEGSLHWGGASPAWCLRSTPSLPRWR